ncbi:MAG TPA: LCP family protein [Egicoccus sp.]|nr:LCP family protein [Egicoccus sp.]HSK21726.1 LCP family protein [Egicoccus sp.]
MTDNTVRGAWGRREPASGWGRRAAFGIGGVVVLLTVIGLVTVTVLNASIDRVGVEGLGDQGSGSGTVGGGDLDGDGTPDAEQDLDPRALTVLVLGSDTREVLTPEERVELSTGSAPGERTEVISLVRLDPDDGEVRMLSIPRDTLLERCDGTTGRVNAAYTIGELEGGRGGATCVVETLRDWLGVRIDHVVKVDFRGFVDIVDALGGVSMYLEEPLEDEDAGLDLDAGCVALDGVDALAFVRARHIDNDFGRMERQQRFVSELRNELASVGVFDDPARALRVAQAVARAVELDNSLTLNRIQQLVREHLATVKGGIEGKVLTGAIETIDGAAYVVVDELRAKQLLRWLMTGNDPAEEPRTTGTEQDGAGGSEPDSGPSLDAGPDDGSTATSAAGAGPTEQSETCR